MDPRTVVSAIFDEPSRGFAVELWDGSILAPAIACDETSRVVVRSPAALRFFSPPWSERRLSDAFISGEIDLVGDAVSLLATIALWKGPRFQVVLSLASVWASIAAAPPSETPAASLDGERHSAERDRAAVRHHYDVSDDFFRLLLDPDMVYSCAYFTSPSASLEDAQRAKLELVCRKLDVRPGDRLLDLGCGWGALVCRAVARGATAIGTTLAENQVREARNRLAALPSALGSEIQDLDYRQIGSFAPVDKVASIGMMEHVGASRLDDYFSGVERVLRPGGLFLNQAIAEIRPGTSTIPWLSRRDGSFIDDYIFPDSELPPIGQVIRAAETAGFEVRDLESLRDDYARTLAYWLQRLEHRFDDAVRLVGQARARAWRLYLASSAVAFRLGRVSVFQLLLAKPNGDQRGLGVPRRRSDWYAADLCGQPSEAEGGHAPDRSERALRGSQRKPS